MKKWEVSLISDIPSYQVVCREFRTRSGAERYMKKNLDGEQDFYCAVIAHPGEQEISTYYWNGRRIVRWNKPYALSSRQAMNIEDEG